MIDKLILWLKSNDLFVLIDTSASFVWNGSMTNGEMLLIVAMIIPILVIEIAMKVGRKESVFF